MRIALVCPYSLSRPGGVQGQVLGLARALETMGHHPLVLAPADGPVAVPGLGSEVVVLGRSLPVPANGSVAPLSVGPIGAWRAVRRIRGAGIDVVHLHEPLAPGAGYACLLGCPQPKVGTFHRAGSSTAYRVLGVLARWAAGRLDVRCAVSPEAMTTAAALGGTYEIVGNGVELDRFARADPWPTNGPTVLFVGRHERRKGLGVLLDAFGRNADGDGTAATLWVVGEGPETTVLRGRTRREPRVEWLGRVDDDELASRLRGAHVLCAPSLGGESFGMVLLEAMAARTAVVASDIPGYAYVSGGHALLVAPGDADALAGALKRAVADAAHGAGLCAPGALDRAVAHASTWSMARLAERYVGIYDDALSSRRRAH